MPIEAVEEHDHVSFKLEYKKSKLTLNIKTTRDFREAVKTNTPDGASREVAFNGKRYLFYEMFRNNDLNDLAAKISDNGLNVMFNGHTRGPSTGGYVNIAHLFMFDTEGRDETTFEFNTIYSKESLEAYASVLKKAIEVMSESFLQPILIECKMTYYTVKG